MGSSRKLGPNRFGSNILPSKSSLSGEGQLFGALFGKVLTDFAVRISLSKESYVPWCLHVFLRERDSNRKICGYLSKRAQKNFPSPERLSFKSSILLPNLVGPSYGVAMISRLLKIIGLFCRI